ncbi:MAG: PEP-CTERM sorting domain-containing protein [Gloeotrichia echinulata IR180]
MKLSIATFAKTALFTGFAASVMFVSKPAQAANLLLNGSFETGDFTGWQAFGGVGVDTASSQSVPSDGTKFANFNRGFNQGSSSRFGSLSQTFSTIKGADYLLSFDFTKGGTQRGPAALLVIVDGDSNNDFLVSTVAIDNSESLPSQYTNYNYTFTGDSSSTTLYFENYSDGQRGFDTNLDNVSVIATSVPPAVPEPTNILGLGVAIIGGGMLKRKFGNKAKATA